MREYTIQRASQVPPMCGDAESQQWASAEVAQIDLYPWFEKGDKQPTTVRLLYDDNALYAQYLCEDRHIYAEATELNGKVWEDSCVELFVAIDLAAGMEYFNLEMNCCGTMLMGWGPNVHDERRRITPELAEQLTVAASLPSPTKEENPADRHWWIAATIPFEVIRKLTGRKAQPKSGDVWRGNFYRIGGKTSPQHACWNPIETERVNFHRPQDFGTLHFA